MRLRSTACQTIMPRKVLRRLLRAVLSILSATIYISTTKWKSSEICAPRSLLTAKHAITAVLVITATANNTTRKPRRRSHHVVDAGEVLEAVVRHGVGRREVAAVVHQHMQRLVALLELVRKVLDGPVNHVGTVNGDCCVNTRSVVRCQGRLSRYTG